MPTETTQANKPLSAPQKALRKMGLVRDVDLALHLPYRYEDETRLTRLADAREGEVVQFEATVRSCEVVFKPRRQLLAVVEDGEETCTLRFFNFYPNMQKALEEGRQVRLRGEIRGGFMGRTCMHPSVQAAGGLLSTALTPPKDLPRLLTCSSALMVRPPLWVRFWGANGPTTSAPSQRCLAGTAAPRSRSPSPTWRASSRCCAPPHRAAK